MGWWSETVLGGDDALDYIGEMQFGICGLDEERYFSDQRLTFEEYNNQYLLHMQELIDYALSSERYEPNIAAQVLGYLVIENGLPLTELVEKALEIAIAGTVNDEWANRRDEVEGQVNSKRIQYMNHFRDQLVNYDGNEVDVADEGLMEVIAKAGESGQIGLINKNL